MTNRTRSIGVSMCIGVPVVTAQRVATAGDDRVAGRK